MHILYLFPESLPNDHARGIQVVHTIVALGQCGISVSLAYVPVPGTDPFKAYGVDRPGNVSLVPLSTAFPGLPVRSGRIFAWRLRRWLAAQPAALPDYVFVRHVKIAKMLLDAGIGMPMIYEAHEIFADSARSGKREKIAIIEGEVVRKTDFLLSITRRLADLLQERYAFTREIPIVASATDLPAVVPQKKWAECHKRVIYAGSLYGWKGVDDLVSAAVYLDAGVEITIIGGGAEDIRRLQDAMPVGGASINFLGRIAHGETMRHLAEACIAILPNRADSVSAFTSPLKLFEYMAYGCALVASDLQVFREVLDSHDVAWFEAGNPKSLAAALNRWLQDPLAAAESANATSLLAEQFTWAARAGKIKAVLSSA